MPELPEVETVRRGINAALLGKAFTNVIIRQTQLRWKIPTKIKTILPAQHLIAIERRAKYLLLQTEKGTLIIHLGMSGRLHILHNPPPAQKHDHVDFIFGQTTLRYTDPRRFGAILWTTDDPTHHPLLTHLGPEPLSKTFNADYLLAKTKNRRIAIKHFIMNHHIVVGVGNIYAAEALFLAKMHPNRSTQTLTPTDVMALCTSIKIILRQAIKAGGTTLKDFSNSSGKPGYFSQELMVYGRAGQPCKQCNTMLSKITIGQRSSVYCPQCQSQ